jgi:hypothetical protein
MRMGFEHSEGNLDHRLLWKKYDWKTWLQDVPVIWSYSNQACLSTYRIYRQSKKGIPWVMSSWNFFGALYTYFDLETETLNTLTIGAFLKVYLTNVVIFLTSPAVWTPMHLWNRCRLSWSYSRYIPFKPLLSSYMNREHWHQGSSSQPLITTDDVLIS